MRTLPVTAGGGAGVVWGQKRRQLQGSEAGGNCRVVTAVTVLGHFSVTAVHKTLFIVENS